MNHTSVKDKAGWPGPVTTERCTLGAVHDDDAAVTNRA